MRRFLPALLVLAGIAVYANSLSGAFLFDDIASIPDNPSIRQLWPPTVPLTPPRRGEAVSGRPVVNLTLAVNYALGDLDVTGYHLWNVATHIACALLLFAIVRRTIENDAAAFACALLWMIHPLQSEAADYIVARTESTMALCLLATLYASIRGWTIAAIAACAIGMACKETMVVAPVLVALYDRAFSYRSWRDAWCARRGLWLGLAATWAVLIALLATAPRALSAGFVAGDPNRPSGSWTYLLNQAPLILRYLRLLMWPSGLVLDYGFPRPLTARDVWPQLLLLAALGAATAVAMLRRPQIGFLGAWFFLTLAPSSSIVPVLTEAGAERRMYLPSMAVIALAVIIARRLSTRRPLVGAAALVVVTGACASATVTRNREYRAPLTMWQATVDRWPQGRARVNLAAALQAAGRTDEMMTQLHAAVSDYPEGRYDLGIQLVARGEFNEGAHELEQFMREFPTHPKAATAREQLDVAHRRMAARLTDEAIGLVRAERPGEAIPLFRRVVALVPDSANAHRNLANALLDVRDYAGAAAEARDALRLNPQDASAREILSLAGAR